jgi:hypothetical protein
MNIILALECSPEKAKKRKRKQYWMKEWSKKRVTFSNQNLLQETVAYVFIYQRLDSN